MSELSEKLLNLEISEGIFKDIKYFIAGEVHEKIEVLLKSGGAERQNYISDYVTHLIAGNNAEENDISDANDVYEIPTVTPRWICMCAILKRRIDIQPYLFTLESKLFSGRRFCFSNVREDLNILWGLITFNGGSVYLKLTRECDYLVTGVTDSAKYEKATLLGSDKIKIVTPDWVVEAVRCKGLPDSALYHPKLINWPKPVKPPEPTTLITGFDEEASEIADKTEEKTLPDSTQALLERLKQRMPWNQPPPTSSPVSVSSSSETVAPPNVVAPSFLSKMQANQRELAGQFKPPVPQVQQQQPPQQMTVSSSFATTGNQSPSPVVRSTIHHPATSQQQMSQQINMQNAQMTINRLLNQQQANKPGLQQIRAQLNTSQMQQQLMQQRMQQQQQQQNIIQRSPNQINQQLLHQQLSQGQRQVLQNQLMNQQSLQQQQQQQQQQQNLININQDSQGLDSGMFSPQGQNNHFNQSTQQLDLNHQRSQIDHSPSPNQVITSPQHNQGQLLSPQHQHQIQNQLLNQQQQQNHIPVSQLQQNNSQLISQQQQIQLSQQQARANQLLQNQNLQQDRVNQLLSQQSQNQLIQQQNQGNQQQQQHMQPQNHEVELLAQSPQSHLMQQNQLMQHNQPSQEMLQQNHQMMQQQNQMIQSQNPQMAQQNQPIIRQAQVINQQPQQQQLLGHNNQGGQQTLLSLPPNHHLSQLSPQQIQQLQQLKREQQQLLNQTQNQMVNQQQNVVLNQQHVQPNQMGQNQQQIMGSISQQQQIQIQNRVIQQQNLNQLQQQNFSPPPMNQHGMVQKQQIFNQVNTSQNQQIQNNQFINQNQFEAIQQNKLQHGNQMNVQALNQQLQQQNLGQQLNQQLLQQNQPQPVVNQPGMGLDQGMMINQQQSSVNQPNNLGMNQINPGVSQQVIRGQFPQQVLVNQGQPGAVQRAQLNQQVWAQQQQQPPTPGGPMQGPQIIRHPVNVSVQQSPTNPTVGPRIQWPPGQQPGVPQRRFIQLDAHTHNQLQKMTPEQQAVFVTKLQKQRQLQLAKQMQGAGGHILIRGNVPQGLTPQQQVQWLQQQAKQQGIVLPPNIQQNLTAGNITPQQTTPPAVAPTQHAPGLSPINQPTPSAPPAQQFVPEQPTAQQLQLRQQYRLQMQREQAQKNAALTQQVPGSIPAQQTMVRPPLSQTPAVDSTTNPQVQVNPKTKTALANMLSIKLQSGGTIGPPVRPEGIPEQSAAGTLRMMTAQHNAAINSKPQEIIALHQRRVITGPGGEIIKPPGVAALPMTPQNEPPKLQFNQGKAPVPVQHRVGPFYGHNPNLKLPPDLFLLGCIFVVVEVEDYLEEKLPGWQQKIEKYGGEVEKQYCSKVTHVLCETQRHGVVMQALRDVKRCVTIRWLSDVIKRKQVLPPWTALHLPQIYLDIAPASKHLISISGFEGNLRQIVKQMILYTGAKCTNYFSKHNTLLISAKEEGKKYAYARKWGIPVVNVQWLTDVILGNYTAMNQMDNQAYQTYTNPPNLSFDPKLVPTMMHAWKAPINISQESYERVKRSASPVSLPKVKKQKTEHTDENENITEDVPANPNYKILLSQFDGSKTKELERAIRELGGIIAKDHSDFTHLVMPKLTRTHKLLFAITKFCHILPDKWLEHSLSSRKFLAEADFSLSADEFNQTFNTNLDLVLKSPLKSRLFDGKAFWITPSVVPRKKILAELIELCGGRVERIRRSRAQIEAASLTAPSTYFIITAKEDLHLVGDLLRNKKDKQRVVCNAELVLSAILRQEFEVEPYAVSVA